MCYRKSFQPLKSKRKLSPVWLVWNHPFLEGEHYIHCIHFVLYMTTNSCHAQSKERRIHIDTLKYSSWYKIFHPIFSSGQILDQVVDTKPSPGLILIPCNDMDLKIQSILLLTGVSFAEKFQGIFLACLFIYLLCGWTFFLMSPR